MAEFDHWTGDTISSVQDIAKLGEAEAYFRQQGFYQTADVVTARLNELSQGQDVLQPDRSDRDQTMSAILSLKEQYKQQQHQSGHVQPDKIDGRPDGPQASIRSSKLGTDAVSNGVSTRQQASRDKFPHNVKHSAELLDQDSALLRGQALNIPSQATAPKPAMAQHSHRNANGFAVQQKAPMVQEVQLNGAKRTQQLLEQNKGLPLADRRALAETARLRGNEHLSAGLYAEAVEEYTLAIGLNPDMVAGYTNRAAAYLKLKQWGYAEVDCATALAAMAGTGEMFQLQAKAFLRRAEARMGLKAHKEALQDYEAVLQLVPKEPSAEKGITRARQALGLPAEAPKPTGMCRMMVIEASSSEDEDDQQHLQRQQQQQQQQPASVDQQLFQPQEHKQPAVQTQLPDGTDWTGTVEEHSNGVAGNELALDSSVPASLAAAGTPISTEQPPASAIASSTTPATSYWAADRDNPSTADGGQIAADDLVLRSEVPASSRNSTPEASAASPGEPREAAEDEQAGTEPYAAANSQAHNATADSFGTAAAATPAGQPLEASAGIGHHSLQASPDEGLAEISSTSSIIDTDTDYQLSDDDPEGASAAAAVGVVQPILPPSFEEQLDLLRLAGNDAFNAGGPSCAEAST
eukprot:GHRR01013761.1.p1 GENE.GHRR01013761.1~~GHRR01013761.1.p1  ORF type:complete len:636 (+),score=276.88 GHRR01013761.1:119-2026(+)